MNNNPNPTHGWQPIATAPRDRRGVLLVAPYPRGDIGGTVWSDPCFGWWDAFDAAWERWKHEFPPTHWAPIPALPKDANDE